jgi:asparagine synthase (glutamine-hydrolysing)
VIDLDTGYQPVSNESGDVVAVFNGEAYNFAELRSELRGHDVRGTGDTTVLPHLYEESGTRFVERLHGMFALAVWDAPRERLVLARDRLGKKPLLYTRLADGTFAFASELKALLRLPALRASRPRGDRRVPRAAVRPGRRHGAARRRKVPPGHVLVVEGESERSSATGSRARGAERDDEEWLERVRTTVGEAVRKRLVADVPLGALLSGGIDSSIVVALMAQASSSRCGRSRSASPTSATTSAPTRVRSRALRHGARGARDRRGRRETLPRLARPTTSRSATRRRFPTFLIAEQARGTSRSRWPATAATRRSPATSATSRTARGARARRAARAGAAAVRLVPGAARSRARRSSAPRASSTSPRRRGERYARLMEVFPLELRRELWLDRAQRPRAARAARAGSRPAAARPRDLPAGRPAAEGGHRVDGALARAALAVPRPRGRRARARAAGLAQGARARGQGRAAPRVRRDLPPEVASAARRASASRSGAGSARPARARARRARDGPRLVPRRDRARLLDEHEAAAPTTATGSGAC